MTETETVTETTQETGSEPAPEWHASLLEQAWGIIANAGWDGGAKSPEWQEAAEQWRDSYHHWLDLHLRGPAGYQTWEQLAVSAARERDALLFEVSQLRRALHDAAHSKPLSEETAGRVADTDRSRD